MERMILAATISFGLGAFGYVLFRFFLLPIRRYRRMKAGVRSLLTRAAAAGTFGGQEAEEIRKLAADISTCYYDELPVYYRLQLTRRNERPIEASQMLMAFSGMKQPEHIRKKANDILEALRCTGKEASRSSG
jgi:hypothetical protein